MLYEEKYFCVFRSQVDLSSSAKNVGKCIPPCLYLVSISLLFTITFGNIRLRISLLKKAHASYDHSRGALHFYIYSCVNL